MSVQDCLTLFKTVPLKSVPRIEITQGVCGGAARIAGTRIPVWLIEEFRRDGASDADLLEAYPSLTAEDLDAAKEWTRLNPDEIDRHLRDNDISGSLRDGSKAPRKAVTFLPGHGVLITAGASDYVEQIKEWVNDERITGESLNASFFKNWQRAIEISDPDRLAHQIMHYFSTYGLGSLGLFPKGDNFMYVPNDVVNLPSDIYVVVIDASSPESIIDRCLKMLNSGALKEETIHTIMGALETCDYDFHKALHVSSREARAIIAHKLGVLPEGGDDLFRYLYFKSTGGKSLVINDDDTEKKVRETRYELPLLTPKQERALAESFNRRKAIWLAIKKAHPRNARTVNKISKLSKAYHKPLPVDVLNNLTNLQASVSYEALSDAAESASLARLVRAYNGVATYAKVGAARFYRIRNGKGFVTTKVPSGKGRAFIMYKSLLLLAIKKRLADKLPSGFSVYTPKYIDYAIPTSEKQFTGDYPVGTKVSIPKTEEFILVGIYWKGSHVDLDLSGVAHDHKIGWDADWRGGDPSGGEYNIMYSGDITSAPNGATEYLYARDINKPYLVKVSGFTVNSEDQPYRLILGYGSDVKSNYVIDPAKVILSAPLKLTQTEMVAGLLKDSDGGADFYILNQGSSAGRVSTFGAFSSTILEYLDAKLTTQLRISDVLSSRMVDDPKDADLDLSPDKLTRDALIDLLLTP